MVDESLVPVLTTYGRVDRQKTFLRLPLEWQRRTVFIAVKDEIKQLKKLYGYTGCEFLAQPKSIKGIAQVHAWLFKEHFWEKVLFLDDDLEFLARRKVVKGVSGEDWVSFTIASERESYLTASRC